MTFIKPASVEWWEKNQTEVDWKVNERWKSGDSTSWLKKHGCDGKKRADYWIVGEFAVLNARDSLWGKESMEKGAFENKVKDLW